jgi:hypothetical protein
MKSSRFGAFSAKGLMGMVERNLKIGFGRHEKLIRRRDNPLWDVFKKEFVEKQGSVER